MSILQIAPVLTGFATRAVFGQRNLFTEPALWFRLSDPLLAEPLKRKKKLDPAVARAREERKKKKLEKQIRRLEKMTQQLKPVEEMEIPIAIIDEKEKRVRHIAPPSAEELERRILLTKEWANYKREQTIEDTYLMEIAMHSQQKALEALREESEELYQEAMQIDPTFLPYTTTGPTRTPPIVGYSSPDGEYVDVTRKFEGET